MQDTDLDRIVGGKRRYEAGKRRRGRDPRREGD